MCFAALASTNGWLKPTEAVLDMGCRKTMSGKAWEDVFEEKSRPLCGIKMKRVQSESMYKNAGGSIGGAEMTRKLIGGIGGKPIAFTVETHPERKDGVRDGTTCLWAADNIKKAWTTIYMTPAGSYISMAALQAECDQLGECANGLLKLDLLDLHKKNHRSRGDL